MKKGVVGHDGVVSEVTATGYKVSIVSKSACAGCHAKGLCSASEMADKIIDVKSRDTGAFKVGDRVSVNMEESMGMRAVWLVYAIPAVILVTFLLYLQRLGVSELATGLAVLGAIAVYFVILFLFRKKIGRHFNFTISPAQEDN
ncbi:MAG: SoxR reducing system RseC family protein [Bacteroidales bacterium]|nr:SoxR reducing system RseC family protein [Bacteroidales bacterium]MBQ1882374.1 SoxR reducing system RseC family protein [Bacteroidales bacterium]MBQ2483509.1 SoxR reducing system RseC family protein [Bacteroidales bacterium]MBQ2492049.1 SoxR reducing system RseC family protein [Bacteroidales bacterium]MBQ4197425.1 SoxR reducing system RseC family protein [Bacteroidales bacterium]